MIGLFHVGTRCLISDNVQFNQLFGMTNLLELSLYILINFISKMLDSIKFLFFTNSCCKIKPLKMDTCNVLLIYIIIVV